MHEANVGGLYFEQMLRHASVRFSSFASSYSRSWRPCRWWCCNPCSSRQTRAWRCVHISCRRARHCSTLRDIESRRWTSWVPELVTTRRLRTWDVWRGRTLPAHESATLVFRQSLLWYGDVCVYWFSFPDDNSNFFEPKVTKLIRHTWNCCCGQ